MLVSLLQLFFPAQLQRLSSSLENHEFKSASASSTVPESPPSLHNSDFHKSLRGLGFNEEEMNEADLYVRENHLIRLNDLVRRVSAKQEKQSD
jgi:hypothetical protein